MGSAEYTKAANLVHARIFWVLCGMMVLYTLYYFYMPVSTTVIQYTYFSSPSLFGVLHSERFHSLYSYMISSYAWLIPLMFLLLSIMIDWKKRWLKIFAIIYMVVLLVLFVCIGGANIAYASTANNPSDPRNPANSDQMCCAAEFYSTYSGCRNFDSASPECNPPILLKELGVNSAFVAQFLASIVVVVFLVLELVFMFQLLGIVDKLMASMDNGGGGSTSLFAKDEDDNNDAVIQSHLPSATHSMGTGGRVVSGGGGAYHTISPAPMVMGSSSSSSSSPGGTGQLNYRGGGGGGGNTRQWSSGPPPPSYNTATSPSYHQSSVKSSIPATTSLTPVQAKAMLAQRLPPPTAYVASPPNSSEMPPPPAPAIVVQPFVSPIVQEVSSAPPSSSSSSQLQPVKLVSALPQAVMLTTEK